MENEITDILSKGIEFLSSFKKIKSIHEIYSSKVNELDKATQDVLHRLELENLSQNEKSKMATLITNIRRDRRFYKDTTEVSNEVVALVDNIINSNPQFLTSLNKLESGMGKIRSKYTSITEKVYHPRVIKEFEIKKQIKSLKAQSWKGEQDE